MNEAKRETNAKVQRQTAAVWSVSLARVDNLLEAARLGSLFVLWTAIVLWAFAGIARAQVGVGNLENWVPAPASSSPLKFNGTVIVDTSQTLDPNTETGYSGSYMVTAGVRHAPSRIAANAILVWFQDYSYEAEDGSAGLFDDPIFTVSRGFKIDSSLVDFVTVVGRGSISSDNRFSRNDTFLGSTGAAVNATKAFGAFSVVGSLRYVRAFHEYEITADGRVNAPDNFRGRLDLDYRITETFGVSATVAYSVLQSYQGVNRGIQGFTAGFDYSLTDRLTATLGIGTDRPTMDVEGSERFLFFDERASRASLGIIMQL